MDGSDAPIIGGLVPAIGPDLDEFDARDAGFRAQLESFRDRACLCVGLAGFRGMVRPSRG